MGARGTWGDGEQGEHGEQGEYKEHGITRRREESSEKNKTFHWLSEHCGVTMRLANTAQPHQFITNLSISPYFQYYVVKRLYLT